MDLPQERRRPQPLAALEEQYPIRIPRRCGFGLESQLGTQALGILDAYPTQCKQGGGLMLRCASRAFQISIRELDERLRSQ